MEGSGLSFLYGSGEKRKGDCGGVVKRN